MSTTSEFRGLALVFVELWPCRGSPHRCRCAELVLHQLLGGTGGKLGETLKGKERITTADASDAEECPLERWRREKCEAPSTSTEKKAPYHLQR